MGLLDQVLGGALGQMGGGGRGAQTQGGSDMLLNMAMQFVANYPGGLPALLSKFAGAGFTEHTQSWIGKGQNTQISAQDITQVFGQSNVQQMGQQFGVDREVAAGGLAGLLPELINQMTPNGQLEEHHQQAQGDELAVLLEGLRKNFA